ncbi:MAG: hypothetical protein HYT79_00980 [Elusimicrobia bacterium]|nr:hypothetical protein [Elusimicrobiota bacterium]
MTLFIPFLVLGAQKSSDVDCAPKAIEGGALVFKNGQRLVTPLRGLSFVGCLASKTKMPYLLLFGRECDECDDPGGLWLHPLNDPWPEDSKKLRRFSYPGKSFDLNSDNKLMEKTRVFFGHCFQDGAEGFILFSDYVFEKTKQVYWVKIDKSGNTTQKRYVKNLPDINKILQKVVNKTCHEIPGKDQYDYY